jgi:hypothetical protein
MDEVSPAGPISALSGTVRPRPEIEMRLSRPDEHGMPRAEDAFN